MKKILLVLALVAVPAIGPDAKATQSTCRAIVTGVARDFNGPMVGDDLSNGWNATFDVTFISTDGIFDRNQVTVHFLDSDGAIVMDNKVRDAMRANSPLCSVGPVISFAPPRRL